MEQGKRKEQYETSAKIAFGGCLGIISILIFCLLMVIGQSIFAQSVYVTKYAHRADLLVYVTPYAHQADKKVCKVKNILYNLNMINFRSYLLTHLER